MSGFLEAFFPNLAATILGVVLGLPVALYVNRRLTSLQHLRDAKAESTRRNRVVDVLVSACEYNAKVLDNIKELSLKGRVMRNADLQITTWEAIGPMLTPI